MSGEVIQGLPATAAYDAIKVAISGASGTGATDIGKAEDGAHTSGDVGIMALTVRQDGAGVALAGTTADYQPLATDAFNLLKVGAYNPATGVAWGPPPTGGTATVAASATPVTILAANTARKGATVYNDSSVVLYLLLGAGTASTSVFTVQMAGGQYYEVPFGFTGILTGLWASASGNARVTEMT